MKKHTNINTVGIIGAGTMGRGIALSFLRFGFEVRLYDIDKNILSNARQYIIRGLEKFVESEKLEISKLPDRKEKIKPSSSLDDLGNCGLIIEAVIENLKLKQDVISQIESITGQDAVIASNTSTFSIDSIARKMVHRERFIGLHFFNPAEILRLVEVIPGEQTDQNIITRSIEIIRFIGKVPIKCKDSPGFIVNRLVLLFINEAMKLLDEKIASIEDIDNAVKLGLNHKIGPLELADMIGLDVLNDILVSLYKDIGEKYKPAKSLKKMIQNRKLGEKTKEGFYKY